jgi:hypothetical protein
MKQQAHYLHTIRHEQWHWPMEIANYDRHPLLYPAEQEELAKLIEHMDWMENTITGHVKQEQRFIGS